MTEKSLGYVELEWTCPACNTRNPGAARKCLQCGASQPEEVEFEQAAEEKILTDETKIADAKAVPDIYCGYCGTRNAAAATACKQCGAALAEGKARAAGDVLGGLRSQPAPPQVCPSCGAESPVTAHKCSKCGAPLGKAVPAPAAAPAAARSAPRWILFAALGAISLVVILLIVLSSRRNELVGEVVDYGWRRTIAVEALVPVTREGWRDSLPADAEVGTCREAVYEVVADPAPNSREVCGTPYVVDKGTGYGEVKQDCEYEVLRDYCQYRVLAWVAAPPLVLEGRDFSPRWPAVQLASNQRAGGGAEEYVIVFQANDRSYRYTTQSEEEYLAFQQGGGWVLEVNGLGNLTAVRPQ